MSVTRRETRRWTLRHTLQVTRRAFRKCTGVLKRTEICTGGTRHDAILFLARTANVVATLQQQTKRTKAPRLLFPVHLTPFPFEKWASIFNFCISEVLSYSMQALKQTKPKWNKTWSRCQSAHPHCPFRNVWRGEKIRHTSSRTPRARALRVGQGTWHAFSHAHVTHKLASTISQCSGRALLIL